MSEGSFSYREFQEVDTQQGYTLWAEVYDKEKNALIALEELQIERLLDRIAFRNALDVGTGTGRVALKLAQRGAKVVALDQSPEMLAVARQSAQSEGLQIDLLVRDIPDGYLPEGFKERNAEKFFCLIILARKRESGVER
jgi:ubiquinone/menaquinone biosynthesis C-methylase UbiE